MSFLCVFMYICSLSAYMFMYHIYAWCLGRLEEDEGSLGAGGLNLGPLEEKPMLFYHQVIFPASTFFPFLINYIYSFISYPECSFPFFLLFSLLPPPPILSSVSVQKEIDLPWISTNHDISSCRRNKLLLFIKAGQGNPE